MASLGIVAIAFKPNYVEPQESQTILIHLQETYEWESVMAMPPEGEIKWEK